MTTPLEEAIAEALKHQRQLHTSELEHRLAIGEIAARVRTEPQTYGAGAMKDLAESLGMKKSNLYNHADVAKVFGSDALSSVRSSGRVSWSHLVALAVVNDQQYRDGLLEAVQSDGLSVRELKRRIKEQCDVAESAEAEDALGVASDSADAEAQECRDSALAVSKLTCGFKALHEVAQGYVQHGLHSTTPDDLAGLRSAVVQHLADMQYLAGALHAQEDVRAGRTVQTSGTTA